MIEFMRDGGVAMWVVLLFGLIALVSAALFARKPEAHKLRFLWAMGLATLFATLSGTVAGLATVFNVVPQHAEWADDPKVHLIIIKGIGESLANSVLGFSLLALTAFVCAFGVRRLPRA